MKTETKTAPHTPTPWHLDSYGKIMPSNPRDGLDSIAINATSSMSHEATANAALIVRAVNAHEKLLSALATMIDGYRTLASTVDEKEVWLTNPGVIRATDTFQAIAKAEGL